MKGKLALIFFIILLSSCSKLVISAKDIDITTIEPYYLTDLSTTEKRLNYFSNHITFRVIKDVTDDYHLWK